MGIGMDAYEQMGRELFEKSQGAPILLIGMGGVGGRIVAQIDKMLAKDSPRRDKVAILAIDTNVKDLRKLREQGIETIQISDERLVRQYLKECLREPDRLEQSQDSQHLLQRKKESFVRLKRQSEKLQLSREAD